MPKLKRKSTSMRNEDKKTNMNKIRKRDHLDDRKISKNSTERMRVTRRNSRYMEEEKEKNVERIRRLRQNNTYREQEREKNAKKMELIRQEPARREQEMKNNAERMQTKRQDREYREQEMKKDAEGKKIIRQNSIYRNDENMRNKKRMKVIRQDPEYKANEQVKNSDRVKIMRQDQEFSMKEKRREAERKQSLRIDDFFRYRENVYTAIYNKLKSSDEEDDEYHQNSLLMKYIMNRKVGPDIVCVCCENLFFPKSVDNFKIDKVEEKLRNLKLNINEFMKKIVNNSSEYVCKTCNKKITSGEIPKTAANSGLRFPILPTVIRDLSAVEERMVSPFIPFMQIRALQPYAINSQLSLKGSIVNIPVEINDMIKILPRTFSAMSTIQIKLKRHLDHKSNYMYETIRPSKVCEALEYLKRTPLYVKNKLEIDPSFFKKYEKNIDAELKFITDDKDRTDCDDQEDKNNMENDNHDCDSEDSDSFEPNDEVLIIDRNKEVSDNIEIIAPGQDKAPIPWHLTENIDEMCFPKIFGGEIFDKENRLSYSQRVKFEARNKDRRSCEPTRILFMAKQKLERSIISSINICLRRVKSNDRLTAEKARDSKFIIDAVRLDDGFKFMKQIRSSPSYWESKKKHLLSMIRQCGIPTFFITLSACEYKNADLLKILHKLSHNENISTAEAIRLDLSEKSELIRNDPVTCVRYIEERFKEIMSILGNKHGPFGNNFVVDYFQRREFQARGSVHTHNLVYCKNAPIYDEENSDSIEPLVKWIDRIITCENDPTNPLISLQTHRHTHTCYKGKKNKSVCRFNIPMFVMKKTMILKPLENENRNEYHSEKLKKIKDLMQELFEKSTIISFEDILKRLQISESDYIDAIRSSLSKTKVFLKRRSNEVAINGYNKSILTLLEANMDIQFVLDPYSCASYMINYVTKVDAGLSRLLREAATDLHNGNLSIREKFRKIANVFINGNTLSAQESVYHVLGLPLTFCSRQAIYINTVPRSERVHMLKSRTELEKMYGESEDIYYKNIIERYERRNTKIEDICLADFAANYEQLKQRTKYTQETDSEGEDDEIEMHQRKKSKIVRFRSYKLQQDEYNYFREQVLLFFPFRNEVDEIENEDCENIYSKNLKTIEENREKFAVVGDHILENAMTDAQNAFQEVENEEVESFMKNRISEHQEIDIFRQVGVEKALNKNKRGITCPMKLNKEEIMDTLTKLNDKQRRITMHILNCFKTGNLPIRVYMSGSAGVGKSMVINTVYQLLSNYFDEQPGKKNDSIKILLCAPSGKAAFLIGGVTLHTAFALPVNEYGGQMPELSADIANTIRESLFEVKLLIIDEISMVGSTMFSRVDTRLRQIMGRNQSFGGVSVMVVGDLYQLPPVKDSPVYKTPKSSMLSVFAENVLWKEFQIFELTEIMRQKDEQCFINALNNLARGEMTDEEITLIRSREKTEKEVPTEAIRLFTENRLVDAYNTKRIDAAEGVSYISKANDSVLGTVSSKLRNKLLTSLKNRKRNDCGGLPYIVNLKIGINYMITSNINVEDGLVNGACGTLRHITFSTENEQPIKLWIDFNNERVGIHQRRPFLKYMEDNSISECLVPISTIAITLSVNDRQKYQTVRHQFPVTPAEALTIHKSQGQTYQKVCIDTRNGARFTRSLLYVALSRVTKLSGLFILGVFTPPKKPPADHPLRLEITRLKEENMLKLSYTEVIQARGLKIIYQNVRSLRKNHRHIACDRWYSQADLLIFSESHSISSDEFILNGFKIVFRTDPAHSRSVKGIICFVRETFSVRIHQHIQKESITMDGQRNHIDLIHLNVKDVDIITGYKSPTIDRLTFTKELKKGIDNIMGDKRIIIGDFNYDAYRDNSFIEKYLNELHFKRAIPAEISTTNFNTQIDVIFVHEDMTDYTSGVYETYFSDHKPIFIGLDKQPEIPISIMDISSIEEEEQSEKHNTHQHENDVNNNYIHNHKRKNADTPHKDNLVLRDYRKRVRKNIHDESIKSNKSRKIEKNISEEDSLLDDESINAFLKIIQNNSPFNPGDITVHQWLLWVQPILTKDLQILGGNESLHWHCIFFDGCKLYIYDSLYFDKHTYEDLEEFEKKFIQMRYQHLSPTNIVFKIVTRQPDSSSCGVYATAFATSIALGKDPSDIKYSINVEKMRSHLMKIINEKKLSPFPEE